MARTNSLCSSSTIDCNHENFTEKVHNVGDGSQQNLENLIPDLPDDIVLEIILRLPLKSLLRFRCVSKTWKSSITQLINSPNSSLNTYVVIRSLFEEGVWFCSLHSLYHEPVIDTFNHDFPVGSCYGLVGSCDGLICIATTSKKDLILWNPFTKECKELPKIPDFDEDEMTGLPFAHYCSFGKCSDGDYKISCFFYCDHYHEAIVGIYSLREDEWKRIDNYPLLNKWRMLRESKFANGKIYWISRPYGEYNNDWEIGYLDIVTEVYGVILKPTNGSVVYERMNLGVSEGRLYLFCHDKQCGDVWSLNGEESWIKVFTIVDSGCFENRFIEFYVLERNGEILFVYDEKKIVIFNIRDSSFRCPKFRGMDDDFHFIDEASSYVPTSISPFCKSMIHECE